VALATQARFLQQALYVLHRQGAQVVVNLQLRDMAFDPGQPLGETAAGIFFVDGSPKPSATAFRFPFVADRKARRTILWGRSPESGRLVVQRRSGGRWQRVTSLAAGSGQVFQRSVQIRGKPALRAKVGGERSLVWQLR
jgi:hypothetical protein